MKSVIKAVETAIEAAAVKTEVAALEYFAHSASFRAKTQAEQLVGLNASGSYVSKQIEKGALTASIEAAKLNKEGKVKWESEESVLIVKGGKGNVARYGVRSVCGKFFEAIGTSGAKGIVSLALLGGKGTMEVFSVQSFAEKATVGTEARFVRKHDAAVFSGRVVGALGDIYSTLVYDLGGRLGIVDIETDQSNDHNALMRGVIGGKAEISKLDTLLSGIIAGTVTRKGVKKAATVKAKTEKGGAMKVTAAKKK